MSDWTKATNTSLSVSDGSLHITCNPEAVSAYPKSIYKNGYAWADYEFTTTIDTTISEKSLIGPMFRVSEDGKNFYALVYLDGKLNLREYANGSYETRTSVGASSEKPVEVTIRVVGGAITITTSEGKTGAYIDTTDPYLSGSIGFMANGKVSFSVPSIEVIDLRNHLQKHRSGGR